MHIILDLVNTTNIEYKCATKQKKIRNRDLISTY